MAEENVVTAQLGQQQFWKHWLKSSRNSRSKTNP